MTFLISLLTNAYTRAVLEIGALGALVFFIGLHIYNSGKAAGAQAAKTDQVNVDAQTFQKAVTQYQADLDAAAQREMQAAQMVAQAQSAATAASNALAVAQAASRSDAGKVQALAPSDVQKDLETKLGGPLSDASVLRKDDLVVTDYPHLQSETQQMSQQIDALGKQANAQADQLNAVTKERDSAMGAYNVVVPLYTRAFNAIPRKRGFLGTLCGLVTFYWACRPAHMSLPNPVTLEKP